MWVRVPPTPFPPKGAKAINKQLWLLITLLLLLLAACGGDDSAATAVPRATAGPSATPTLRSTPLPTVASPVPLGVEEHPIKIAFVGEMTTAKGNLARNLGEALSEEMNNFPLGYTRGVSVEIIALDNRQEALNTLCNNHDTIVLIDAFTYIAAENRCGAEPTFQIRRGTGRNALSGTSFELIVNTRIVPNLTNLTGRERRFCAESLESEIGFIYPSLALRQYNVDLLNSDIIEIVLGGEETFETDVQMVQGLAGGANQRICESAALPTGRFEEILDELTDEEKEAMEDVGLFTSNEVTNWPTIPYEVLVFPSANAMPEALRQEVIRAISAIIEDDGDANDDMKELFDYTDFVSVTAEDFADFRTWLQAIGWNMAAAN